MKFRNLSGIPFNIPSKSGPVYLAAQGEAEADVDAVTAAMLRQSPIIEVLDDDVSVQAPAPVAQPAPASVDTLDALRARYEALTGEAPDGRWKETRLREEIEAFGDDPL